MPTKYPVVLEDDSGVTRIEGELEFAAATPSWLQSGAGSPLGAVVPTGIGSLYVDTTNGGLYQAVGATNADWVGVGGAGDAAEPGISVRLAPLGSLALLGPSGGTDPVAELTDDFTYFSGLSLGLGWNANGADGTQTLTLKLGNAGQFTHVWDAAGAYVAPGMIDAASLGPTIPYVTMQAQPPVGPYQTPLVHDSTAVTGGLYAWDGSAYQKVTTGP